MIISFRSRHGLTLQEDVRAPGENEAEDATGRRFADMFLNENLCLSKYVFCLFFVIYSSNKCHNLFILVLKFLFFQNEANVLLRKEGSYERSQEKRDFDLKNCFWGHKGRTEFQMNATFSVTLCSCSSLLLAVILFCLFPY